MISEAVDEQAPDLHKSTEIFEQPPNGEKLRGDPGNLDCKPSTTNMTGDKEKEKEKKKPTKPDQEPFEAWEREEMEKLLGELRGHLGERFFSISRVHDVRYLTSIYRSHISHKIFGRRGYRE